MANIAAIVVIFFILVYLWLDKQRFHIERQFRAAEPLFDRWMECARELPGCGEAVSAYFGTRNNTNKYRAVGIVSERAWGYETGEMKKIAEELAVFLGVYNALAEKYNRRLNSRFTGCVAGMLGFRKLPNLKLEAEHV